MNITLRGRKVLLRVNTQTASGIQLLSTGSGDLVYEVAYTSEVVKDIKVGDRIIMDNRQPVFPYNIDKVEYYLIDEHQITMILGEGCVVKPGSMDEAVIHSDNPTQHYK